MGKVIRLSSDGKLHVHRERQSGEATALEAVDVARRYHLSWRQMRGMPRVASRARMQRVVNAVHRFTGSWPPDS